MRRIVGFSAAQVWESYAAGGVREPRRRFGDRGDRRALEGQAPTMLVFADELVVGALALARCIRSCPLPGIRRELRMRLDAAGVLGAAAGWRWRLAPLVVGRLELPPERQP